MADVFDQVAEPDVFDQASEPVAQTDVFDEAAVQEAPKQPLGELSSRVLSSSAKGGLQAATMGMRLAEKTSYPFVLLESVNKAMGLPSFTQDIITELEGAASRTEDEYGVDPKFNDRFISTAASGAGSILPTIASGPLAPVTAALMGGESGLQEAREAGATPTQQVVSAVGQGATAFVTERLLGLPALLKSAARSKVPEKTFKTLVSTVTKEVGKGFVREGTQETLEQISNDTIAAYIAAYDPERKIFDPKKLATTFVAGGLIGGPLGGVFSIAENASPEQIAPREEMQGEAAVIDQSLSDIATAQPPAPEMPPVAPELQVAPEPTPVTPEATTEPTAPAAGGFLGAAINTPKGVVTGETFESPHVEAINKAAQGLTPEEGGEFLYDETLQGFAFQKPDGTTEWVDRVEAGRRLTESGQLVGLKPGTPLTSEHIRNKVEGVTFTPEPTKGEPSAVQVESPDEEVRGVPQQPIEDEGGMPTPKGPEQVPSRSQERGPTPQPKITPEVTQDEAAEAIEPFRDAAIAMAKNQGATDINAEDIFQEVQVELSRQVAEGKTDLSKIGGLVSKAIKNKTANFLQREARKKRGGGLVESGDIEGPTGETSITEAPETRGPRAAAVSEEDVQSIEQAISTLPEGERKVMQLMVEQPGISDADLASQTGLNENAVRQAKFRARNKLKDFIRKQGIGERMAPGAANVTEFRRARLIAATDIYQGLEGSGQLTREVWERNMERIYEDTFTPEEYNELWVMGQEASRQAKEGNKPVSAVISQMLGIQKGREGYTALKNEMGDKERHERGLSASYDVARRSQPSVWDEAMRRMDQDPKYQESVINKLRADPRTTLNDVEIMTLLHAKIDAQNEYDSAVDRVNQATTEQERLTAVDSARKAESEFLDILDLSKIVGSEQGRAFAARKMLVSREYGILPLTAELQAAQFGEELTTEQRELVRNVVEKVNETQSAFDTREEQLEEQESVKALEEKIKELQGRPILDSRILSIAEKIVSKLDAAADKARERIKNRAFSFNAGVDPTVLYDVAVIGASKIAHGLRDLAWKIAMRNEFGEGINPYLDDIYQQSDQMINDLEKEVPETDRKKVRSAVRKTGTVDVMKDTEAKLKARFEKEKSFSKLRPYVQKMALAMVRSGVDSAQGLVDAIHPILQKYQPTITRRQTADLISGYGDFKELDKDAMKATLRDLKGQLQQLSKLEDIFAKQSLAKTGIERRAVSDLERRLIREVNEAKRKMGVVVTDPTKQLRSAQDAIKTNLRNQIRDLTTQIETGEKPVPGTSTPTDAEIESLKATRDMIKQTLAEIEGKPEATLEQRISASEKALEKAIKELETRIKNKDIGPTPKAELKSAKLDALRAQRDALNAELDALRAADQDYRDTQTFDRLMKTASELEAKLARGEVAPKTKAEKMEDELVKEARQRISDLREQMRQEWGKTPAGRQKKLDAAIRAVERSISSYDSRLKSGSLTPSPKGPSVSSPILERLQAERDVMRKLVSDLRKPTPLTPEQLALKNLKARTLRQNAELQDRIARGDFSKKVRKPLDISKDPEVIKALAENRAIKREYEKAKYEAMLKGQNLMEKIFYKSTQTLNLAKSSVGSVDLSAFARQAAAATASRPFLAFKNLILSVQSMNEKKMNKVNAELELRDNAKNGYYRMGKVAFTELDGPLAKREETFRSDWGKKVPWINWSNRQFVTFLNLMRADLFDKLVQSGPVNPTPEQLRAFGRTVNILTGRGEFGKFEGATDLLAIPMWSPRLYLSRLQTLAGYPIWQKDAKGVRKAIAKEYLRAAGTGTVIALLGALAGASIEWDPESSDFLKLKFGSVRIDPWGGHQQWLVFLYRMLTGKYETAKGKKFDLDYPNKRPGPYDPTYGDTATRMFRSKLNPIAQGAWEFQTGRDINGDPVSKTEAVAGSVLPLSIFNDDIVPIAREYGYDRAAAAQMLNMIGVGVQHYEAKEKR